jgi:carbonic anhydrase
MGEAEKMLAAAASRAHELAVAGMGPEPQRHAAILTCMDVRINPLQLFGLERGEAHVLRNAGGLVTEDMLRSLSASQRLLGTREVLLVMHEGCGLLGASDDEFAATLAADGVRPGWRLGGFADLEAALAAGVERLRASPELPCRDQISGLVFDPASGSLREVIPAAGG